MAFQGKASKGKARALPWTRWSEPDQTDIS